MYPENNIFRMLNFLIDNIFIVFGEREFQQTVGIPMGTNCTHFIEIIPLRNCLNTVFCRKKFVKRYISNKDDN